MTAYDAYIECGICGGNSPRVLSKEDLDNIELFIKNVYDTEISVIHSPSLQTFQGE